MNAHSKRLTVVIKPPPRLQAQLKPAAKITPAAPDLLTLYRLAKA